MKDIERQILDYLMEMYANEKKKNELTKEEVSFFFEGIFNGIDLCVECLNCEVSEEFSIEYKNLLEKLIKEAEE